MYLFNFTFYDLTCNVSLILFYYLKIRGRPISKWALLSILAGKAPCSYSVLRAVYVKTIRITVTYINIYADIWPYNYDNIKSYILIYNYVWLCMITYNLHVRSYMILYDHIWIITTLEYRTFIAIKNYSDPFVSFKFLELEKVSFTFLFMVETIAFHVVHCFLLFFKLRERETKEITAGRKKGHTEQQDEGATLGSYLTVFNHDTSKNVPKQTYIRIKWVQRIRATLILLDS